MTIFGHRMGRENFTGTHPAFRFTRARKTPTVAITDAEREQIEPECPKCGAKPGYWCLTEAGMPASEVCPERVGAATA